MTVVLKIAYVERHVHKSTGMLHTRFQSHVVCTEKIHNWNPSLRNQTLTRPCERKSDKGYTIKLIYMYTNEININKLFISLHII